MTHPTHVIGGGLAGCEAAWQLAQAGTPVVLHEMRPERTTEAHRTDALAELVCSNSFRSDDAEFNAVGVLHAEMRKLGSLILACADRHAVPAGGALAVDRDGFAAAVTEALAGHPLIASDGACLGTLCILDKRPRDLDARALQSLKDLASIATFELEAGRRGVPKPPALGLSVA